MVNGALLVVVAKFREFEVPPPGPGFDTVTMEVPSIATSTMRRGSVAAVADIGCCPIFSIPPNDRWDDEVEAGWLTGNPIPSANAEVGSDSRYRYGIEGRDDTRARRDRVSLL